MSDMTRKNARKVLSGSEKIERLLLSLEANAGRLASAVSANNKTWLTYEDGMKIYKRLSSIQQVIGGIHSILGANMPSRDNDAGGYTGTQSIDELIKSINRN